MVALKDIPFRLDPADILTRLKINIHSEDSPAEEFAALLKRYQEIAKPKALYQELYIEEKGENFIRIGDVTFTSLALRRNLDDVNRIFAYVATCGVEADEVKIDSDDYEQKMWSGVIKMNLLELSLQYLKDHLRARYQISNLSHMNPGSGDADVWPIEQQKILFSVMGDVEAQIGVALRDTMLMTPDMTSSGVLFPTEVSYQNCQLCHREDCVGRQAPFSQKLWESIYKDEV